MGLAVEPDDRFMRIQPHQPVVVLDLQGGVLPRPAPGEEGAAAVPDRAVVVAEEVVGMDERTGVQVDEQASLLAALAHRRLRRRFAGIEPAARQVEHQAAVDPIDFDHGDPRLVRDHGEGDGTVRVRPFEARLAELRRRHQSTP